MAKPEDNENCHHMQNDSRKCKINLEKLYSIILWSKGVINESFAGGAEPTLPSGEIGLSHAARNSNMLWWYGVIKESFPGRGNPPDKIRLCHAERSVQIHDTLETFEIQFTCFANNSHLL